MNTFALFLACLAIALFLLDFSGWVARSLISLGLAVLTTAWIVQLVALTHSQHL